MGRVSSRVSKTDLWWRGDDKVCHWCFVSLAKEEATIDHVMPRASGGRDDLENVVLACVDCNAVRGFLQEVVRGRVKRGQNSMVDRAKRFVWWNGARDPYLTKKRLAAFDSWLMSRRKRKRR